MYLSLFWFAEKMVVVGAILCGTQGPYQRRHKPKWDKMVVGAILCATQIFLPTMTLYPNMIKWWWGPSCALCAGPRYPTNDDIKPKCEKMVVLGAILCGTQGPLLYG